MKRCSVVDCESPVRSKGLCWFHYRTWLQSGEEGLRARKKIPAADQICSIDGCERPVRAKGLCSRHYDRALKTDTCGICGGTKERQASICRSCHEHLVDATNLTEKECTKCARLLPIESFGWRPNGNGGAYKRRSRCRDCESAYAKERYAASPEKRQHRNALSKRRRATQSPEEKELRSLIASAKKLRLDPDEVVRQWDARGHKCEVCLRVRDEVTMYGRFHIDHDHETGVFRGFLCSPCNTSLGQMGDDPARLRAAADYIERHRI